MEHLRAESVITHQQESDGLAADNSRCGSGSDMGSKKADRNESSYASFANSIMIRIITKSDRARNDKALCVVSCIMELLNCPESIYSAETHNVNFIFFAA